MYPEYAEINGKRYKIDTDYRTALKCFEVIDDKKIDNYERAAAIIYLLFDFIPEDNNLFIQLLEKARIFLQCGKTLEEQKSHKKDFDFNQDEKYIVSSFMSDYHIDLSKTKLHFWQFIQLIEGLTEASSLSRIREIRNYDVSQEKDKKRAKQIKDLQRELALKSEERERDFSSNEIDSMNEFYKSIGE